MDDVLRKIVSKLAIKAGIESVSETFFATLTHCMAKPVISGRGPRERAIIEACLISGALRIARIEKKSVLEADDIKASYWSFNGTPTPNDAVADNTLRPHESKDTQPPYPQTDQFQKSFHEYELESQLLSWSMTIDSGGADSTAS